MSSAQLATALAFVDAINASDVDAIASTLSDLEFSHQYMPTTIGLEATGPRNKAQTLEVFRGTFANVVDHMKIKPVDIVQGQHSVVLLVKDNGVKKGGAPYSINYVMFLRFADGTDKIMSVVEFQDSLYVAREFAGWYETPQRQAA